MVAAIDIYDVERNLLETLDFWARDKELLDRMIGKAMRSTRNRSIAEEIIQEAFFRTFKSIKKGSIDSSRFNQGYVWKVLNRLLKNRFQRVSRNMAKINRMGTEAIKVLAIGAHSKRKADQYRSDTKEMCELVMDAADSSLLTDRQRETLNMFATGMEYHEIAEELGVPIGTIESNIHRARKKLRKFLESAYFDAST